MSGREVASSRTRERSGVVPLDSGELSDGTRFIVFDENDLDHMRQVVESRTSAEVANSLDFPAPRQLDRPQSQRVSRADERPTEMQSGEAKRSSLDILRSKWVTRPVGAVCLSVVMYSGARFVFSDEGSWSEAIKKDYTVENVLDSPQAVVSLGKLGVSAFNKVRGIF